MKLIQNGSSILLALALVALSCNAQVTTSQYDNFRTGSTLNEKTLTPQNVNAKPAPPAKLQVGVLLGQGRPGWSIQSLLTWPIEKRLTRNTVFPAS